MGAQLGADQLPIAKEVYGEQDSLADRGGEELMISQRSFCHPDKLRAIAMPNRFTFPRVVQILGRKQ